MCTEGRATPQTETKNQALNVFCSSVRKEQTQLGRLCFTRHLQNEENDNKHYTDGVCYPGYAALLAWCRLTPTNLENHSYSNAHFIDAETGFKKGNLLSIIPLACELQLSPTGAKSTLRYWIISLSLIHGNETWKYHLSARWCRHVAGTCVWTLSQANSLRLHGL